MVSFSWLHLTDLHLGMEEQVALLPVIQAKFFEDVKILHDKSGPWDLVVFTGDLTYMASKAEFQQVDDFLGTLWGCLEELGSQPCLLAVPGNHDLVRPQPDPTKVPPPEVLILRDWEKYPEIQTTFWNDPNSNYRNIVNNAFANYVEWWQKSTRKPNIQSGLLPGDFSAVIEKSGASLGIVGLNSSFLQLAGGDFKGKLVIDSRQFQAVCGGNGPTWVAKHNTCLLLTHQPPDWLIPQSEEHFVAEVAGNDFFAAHLFGHMHEARYKTSSEGGASELRACQASSLFGLEYEADGKKLDRRHGYSVGRIELEGDKGSLTLWPRRAEHPGGQWHFGADAVDFKLTDDHTKAREITLLRTFAEVEEKKSESAPSLVVSRPFANQWAVMVGVNDYTDAIKLRYCRQDVIDLAKCFRESLGFQNIFEFHDESPLKPERDAILKKLVELRGKIEPNDLFVFYFSGHGLYEGGKDYLLPSGCAPRDAKTLGIQIQDVADLLKQFGCKNTAMFIDACREEQGAKSVAGTASVGEESKTILSAAGIIAFFSCDPKDRSFEIDELQHGSFTYCLMQAIKEGVIETVSELAKYLKDNVPPINTKYGKKTQQPYAVIGAPEMESVEIFFNKNWRIQVATRFEPLIDKFVELYNKNENVVEQLAFLDSVKEKKQLDQIEKKRVEAMETFCGGKWSLQMFLRIWKGPSGPGGSSPGPQMKKSIT